MEKLLRKEEGLYITKKVKFQPVASLKQTTIEKVFDFSFKMSFGKVGEHRHYRSGGTHMRRNGEIFANTFQGKLSEFALYNQFYNNFEMTVPDIDTYGLGEWDSADFVVNKKKISVKSTKSFGNLLLLETKDWNAKGEYIPNISKGDASYDFFIFVRIEPFCEELLKKIKALYVDEIDREKLYQLIMSNEWKYDMPGFVTRDDIITAIKSNLIIDQGELLNGSAKMDARNYYVQTGDMRPIHEIVKLLV